MTALVPALPDVHLVGGVPKTTSINVAHVFGKRHTHVLDAIKTLDCSEEFRQPNFRLAEYFDTQGKPRPMYELTRDGFTFLVMGFTGKEAARFKEDYITAFNRLAEQAQRPPAPQPETVTLTKDEWIATQTKVNALLEAKIELLELRAATQPKRRSFTEAEKAEVLRLAAQGLTPKAIGERLGRSPDSVGSVLYRHKKRGGAA